MSDGIPRLVMVDGEPYVSHVFHQRFIAELQAENVKMDDALTAAVEEQDRLRSENEARSQDVGRLANENKRLRKALAQVELLSLDESAAAFARTTLAPGGEHR